MNVLIVASKPLLGCFWQNHLSKQGIEASLAKSCEAAIEMLDAAAPDLIVLDLDLEGGEALSIADYANFRHPKTKVVFVTNSRFFSDGSIFKHASNACAYIPSSTPAEDLSAIIEHYAEHR